MWDDSGVTNVTVDLLQIKYGIFFYITAIKISHDKRYLLGKLFFFKKKKLITQNFSCE
jgi:hypothetical protein